MPVLPLESLFSLANWRCLYYAYLRVHGCEQALQAAEAACKASDAELSALQASVAAAEHAGVSQDSLVQANRLISQASTHIMML